MTEAQAPLLEPVAQWYALSVHGRQEKAAATALVEKQFEVFLPLRVERRPWADRVKRVELALFPGYLFVRTHLDALRLRQALSVRQVFDWVGRQAASASPLPRSIPSAEIESLRLLIESQRELEPAEGYLPGDEIEIGAGPFKGVRGVVLEGADGSRRLVAQIALLGRGVRVRLQTDDLL